MKKFSLSVLITSTILFIVWYLFFNKIFLTGQLTILFPVTVVFFALISILSFYLLKKTFNERANKFNFYFILAFGIRFILSLFFLVFLFLIFGTLTFLMAIIFIILYFIFTFLEIIFLYKTNLKN